MAPVEFVPIGGRFPPYRDTLFQGHRADLNVKGDYLQELDQYSWTRGISVYPRVVRR
jgi:hypothetical protein